MTILDTDREAFLATIRANPHDDVPRLVYADWLDEHDGTVECEACHGKRWRTVRTRTAEMSADEWGESSGPCTECRATGRVSKGYAERAELIRVQVVAESAAPCRSCSVWSQRDCREPGCRFGLDCRASALVASIDHPEIPWYIGGGGPGETRMGVFYRRGFIHCFRGTLQSCLDHLPRLVRHPDAVITRVRVTDREPYMGMDGRVRQWRWHDSATPSGLPSNLFDLLERHPSDIRKFVTMKTYPTRELSESALSEALIRLALE